MSVEWGEIKVTYGYATVYVPYIRIRTGTWPLGESWYRR